MLQYRKRGNVMNYGGFIGRVANEPVFGQTQNGRSYLRFDLAVDRPENRDNADFLPVVVWAGMAESVSKYLTKGRLIFVSGRLLSSPYEKSGVKFKSWTLHGNELQYLDKAKGGSGAGAEAPPTEAPDQNDPWKDES
jgi:single-strand DNA-binding protein